MRQRSEQLWNELTLRPLACCCTAFALAVFLSVYLLRGWQMLLGGGALLLLGLVFPLRGHKLAGAVMLAAMVGLWMNWLWIYQLHDLETHTVGQTLPLTMQAQTYAGPTRYGSEVEVKVTSTGPLQGRRMILYVSETLTAQPGDCIDGEVKVKTARGTDQWELYQYANGILAKGSAKTVEVTRAEQVPLSLLPVTAARALDQALEGLFPPEQAGFLLALTTGDRGKLDPELKTLLSDTGLSHIVAASGLHVSILVTAVFLLPGNRRRRSLVLLPLMGFYAAVAGFSPSICRAVLMEGILLLAPLLEREEDSLTSLTLALALILLHNPMAAASVSLQLSFAAMLGLLVLVPRLRRPGNRYETRADRAQRRLYNSLVLTFGANFFTLPLVLCWFGSASGLSPLSNLAVLWLLPVLLPLALGTAVTALACPPLGALLAKPTGLAAGIALGLIHGLGSLPRLAIRGGWAAYLWVLALWGVTALVLVKRKLPRWSKRLAAGLVAVGFVLLVLPMPEPDAPVRIDVLDVGQGQCILLASEGFTGVIDCGSQQKRAGGVLVDALDRRGIQRVDLLMFTHYDSDHTNGVETLLEQVPVGTALLPEPVEEDGERASALTLKLRTAGAKIVDVTGDVTTMELGLLTLRLTMVGGDDEYMAAALCSAGDFDFLVTGDADMDGEGEVLQKLSPGDIEVLMGGHHGSKYATGTQLLEQTTPEAVVFSVGRNSYGHPTQEALSRCRDAGAQVHRTDREGSVTVLAREDGGFQIVLAK